MTEILWDSLETGIVVTAIYFVVLSTIPFISGLFQVFSAALFSQNSHLTEVANYTPHLAVLIPAWNEQAVIDRTLANLLAADYPSTSLRLYVIDDGSTDETPIRVMRWRERNPEQVFLIQRENGGQGKAHTLNAGLEHVLTSDWAELLLFMDADVVYPRKTLKKMVRHFSDPEIAAVTGNIQEGSAEPTWVQRYVRAEYIEATALSRRSQSYLGFLACLSGGSQMHRRENLEHLGGRIFTDTMVEDTHMTIATQLQGRRCLFDPHAQVFAEEPDTINALWKQRIRWARGNIELSDRFSHLWLNKHAPRGLGTYSFALIWFAVVYIPFFQLMGSVAMITLFLLRSELALFAFHFYWSFAGLSFLVSTLTLLAFDTRAGWSVHREGFLFPGIISLTLIFYALIPLPLNLWESTWVRGSFKQDLLLYFIYSWAFLSPLLASLSVPLERVSPFLARLLIRIVGYGALLSAITLFAYIYNWQGASNAWIKTEKKGKAPKATSQTTETG